MGRLKRLTLWCCAMLMLSTACSITDETTVTAASDDTPAPTDGTAALTDTVATPGDITPVPGDDTAAPTITVLPTDSMATPDGTAAPGDGTAAPTEPAAPNGTATPTTEPSTSEPSLEPVSKESDSYFYLPQLPDFWLTNPYDTSTPLGQLCWALVEFVRIEFIESFGNIAASPVAVTVDSNTNGTAPDVSDIIENENNPTGPTGVANEELEVSTQDTDTYLDALDAIQEPRIVRVVDDPGLSEELQVFAKGLFEMIAAVEEQARIVGYRNIDHSQLPYKDIESLPNLDTFYKAVTENPTQCPSPDQDTEQIMEDWRDKLNELNNITD